MSNDEYMGGYTGGHDSISLGGDEDKDDMDRDQIIDKDDYEEVVFEHDFQRDLIMKCLVLVEQYIKEHKLILVGGMAIDYALQTKGKKLYAKNKLPDYDFYSPEFHLDAYKIGEKIAKFTTGVSVIRGLHASTMRVRVNFVPVADVTYMPKNIFDTIPRFLYKGLTMAHPHFLMIDQHRALSLPFENPPKETVLGRWKKDMQRFDLLSSNFKIENKRIKNELYSVNVDKKILLGNCLGGYAGLLYWISRATKDKFKCVSNLKNIGSFELNDKVGGKKGKIVDGDVKLELPDDQPITIITDDFEKSIEKLKVAKNKITYYNALTDKIPRRVEVIDSDGNCYEFIDNKGRMLSATVDGLYTISCLQDILCYLLTFGVMTKDRKSVLTAYEIGIEILYEAAEKLHKELKNNKDGDKDGDKDDSHLDSYLPNVNNIYGNENWSESYILMLEDISETLSTEPKDEKKISVEKTPKNGYFDNGKKITPAHLAFQIDKSPIYSYDGSKCEQFEPRHLPI